MTESKQIQTKAVRDISNYLEATVTVRDRTRSIYSRNIDAIELLDVARGYVYNCADTIALAASQQPLRLYRTGSVRIQRAGKVKTRRARSTTEHILRSGRMGRKAATWSGMGGNTDEVTDHPVLNLLTRPNTFQNGEAFDYQRFLMSLLTGEMFHLVEGGRFPEHLWPMLPQYTQILPDIDGIVGSYAYGRERSRVVEYPAKEVLHFKFSDHPENPYHGYGPLHWCYQAARIVAENEDFDLEFIDNGNIPLAFITLDPTVYGSDTAINNFMEYLGKITRGSVGKSRAIVGAGMSVSSPMLSSKDLQTIEKLNTHKATIRNAFKVPESLLELNSANLASANVGDDQFWGMTIRPLLNRAADHLTEMLLPMFGLEPGEHFFAYDDPLLADIEREARIAEIDLRSGVRNINEVRSERNLDSIGSEGDRYRISGVPIEQSGEQQPQQPFFTLNDHRVHEIKMLESGPQREIRAVENNCSDEKSGEDAYTDETTESEVGASEELDSGESAQEETKSAPEPLAIVATLADRHIRDDPYDFSCYECGISTKSDENEPPVTINPPSGVSLNEDQEQAFTSQRALVAAAVIQFGSIISDFMLDAQQDAASSIRAGNAIDLSELEAQLEFVLEPEFRQMYRVGFDIGAIELDEPVGTDPLTLPNARAIADVQTSLVRQLSRDISDHTAQAIELRIRAGLDAGDSIDEIASAIEGDTDFAKYRSERIARTEVLNASNAGKIARYKESNVSLKYWIPGTSAVHRALGEMFKDGIPIDEPFLRAGQSVTAGGKTERFTRDVYWPPARPNCTCTVTASAPGGK